MCRGGSVRWGGRRACVFLVVVFLWQREEGLGGQGTGTTPLYACVCVWFCVLGRQLLVGLALMLVMNGDTWLEMMMGSCDCRTKKSVSAGLLRTVL